MARTFDFFWLPLPRLRGLSFSDSAASSVGKKPSYVAPKSQEPYSDNPVMREVMKYLSPGDWDNVNEFIK